MNFMVIIRLYSLLILLFEVLSPSVSSCQFIYSPERCSAPAAVSLEENGGLCSGESIRSSCSNDKNNLKDGESGIEGDDENQVVSGFARDVIDTVVVLGNQRTRRRMIIKEMASKRGEGFDPDLIERDSSYLMGLGFFSSVDISVEKVAGGGRRVVVRVKERPNLFMKYPFPVLDYDFKDGIRYGIRWRVKNFRGLGEDLSVDFKKRRDREHGGGASWYIPWVYGKRMRLSLAFFNYRRLDEPDDADFVKDQNGIRSSFGLPLSSDLVNQIWMVPLFSIEERRSRLTIPGNSECPKGVYFRQNLLTLGFTLVFDSRNTWIVPTKGIYSRFSLNYVFPIRGLEQEYSFCSFSCSRYTTFSNLGTLITAIRVNNYEGYLPNFYKMGLGGGSDLRGYRDDFRGSSKIVGTLQWRKTLYGPRVFDIPRVGRCDLRINLIAFVDTGALENGFEYFNRSLFHSTIGGGIEVLSPIQDIVKFELATDRYGYSEFYMTSGTRF